MVSGSILAPRITTTTTTIDMGFGALKASLYELNML